MIGDDIDWDVTFQFDQSLRFGYQKIITNRTVGGESIYVWDFKASLVTESVQSSTSSPPTCDRNSGESWPQYDPTFLQDTKFTGEEKINDRWCARYDAPGTGDLGNVTVWVDYDALSKDGTFDLVKYSNGVVTWNVNWFEASVLDASLFTPPSPQCCVRPKLCVLSPCGVLETFHKPKCSYDYCLDNYCGGSCTSYKLYKDGKDVTGACSATMELVEMEMA